MIISCIEFILENLYTTRPAGKKRTIANLFNNVTSYFIHNIENIMCHAQTGSGKTALTCLQKA